MKPATKFLLKIFLLTVSLGLLSCSSQKAVKDNSIDSNIDHLEKWGRIYWDQRSSPEKAKLAPKFIGNAVSLSNKNYELSVLLSRAYHFQGHYLEQTTAIKDSLFQLGMVAGYNALMWQLDIEGDPEDGLLPENIISILPDISVEEVPALYWWTVNFGRIMINKPILERLKFQESFEAVLYKLTSLEPNYYFGGPYRTLGVFYSRIPGADLNLAKTNFEQSIQIFPKYFATQVLMAEYYYVKIGDREKFHELLEKVVNDDPTNLPAAMGENLNEQKKAQKLLEKEASLFE